MLPKILGYLLARATVPPMQRVGPLEAVGESGHFIDDTIWDDPANIPQMDYRIRRAFLMRTERSVYEPE